MRSPLFAGLMFAALAAACVTPSSVECRDGIVCPAGHTCVLGGCRSPEQLAACSGSSDGEVCSLVLGAGTCLDGACIVAICGNGIVEPGEVCDDGNTTGGDGCNGTCSSDETCGNGILELAEQCDCGDADRPGDANCDSTFNGGAHCRTDCTVRRCGDGVLDPGEVCDDGNDVPGDGCSYFCMSDETCGNGFVDYGTEQCDTATTHALDGCSADCRVEPLEWRAHSQSSTPLARSSHAMTYDSARHRVVLFGGVAAGSNHFDETWEWDGRTWTERALTGTRPPARHSHAMTYDAARGRVVLFGGNRGGSYADTWEWDGTSWTQVASAGPPARAFHAMTYDAARGRVVLFGGSDGNNNLDDTWEWDGTSWTERTPTLSASPPARALTAMTYDPVRGRVVLFGGFGDDFLADTWEWDGTTWIPRTTGAVPARYGHAMTFDPVRGRAVVVGGQGALDPLDDTWEWNGVAWTERLPASAPGGRTYHALTYDIARGRLVLFGGVNFDYLDDTWEWDETPTPTWTERSPIAGPPALTGHAMSYDAARGLVVLFSEGGDTWEWDGTTWTQHLPATAPGARRSHVMAYDATRRRVVLFGGFTLPGNVVLADTWEWDGTTWTQRLPATSPSPRYGSAMTYDVARGRIVLFGGFNSSYLADTWEWEGTTWTQRTPATSPPPRIWSAMTYDAGRGRIVLFGGANDIFLADTWEWDGTEWTDRTPATGPLARFLHSMTYDPVRDRVVLFGGSGVTRGDLADVWDWNGASWTQPQLPLTRPTSREGHAMTYDAARGRIVLFGGARGQGGSRVIFADTWSLGFTPFLAGEACSSGIDYDRDGAVGCADDDCWAVCTPLCPPGSPQSCVLAPGCGDGVCTAVEDCRSCPADCAVGTTACPVVCGDSFCDASTETLASCPGDCS